MQILAGFLACSVFAALFWSACSLWERRAVAAARQAAAALEGRYEKGGRFSGGTIFGRRGDRDVVVDFYTGSSGRPARTTAMATLKRLREKPLRVRRGFFGGWEDVEKLPAGLVALLARLDGFRMAELQISSTQVDVGVAGVLRKAGRILELAELAAAMAVELDKP